MMADISTNAGAISSLQTSKANDADVIKKDGSVAFTGDQSMGGSKLTSLAAGSESGDAVNFGQLSALQTLINNFEFKNSALDYVTNNTLAPATEVSGDRYVLSHDGGTPHVDWDGASAGDIVEFNGTSWVATTPTAGTFIAMDDESDGLYLFGGSAWAKKNFEATTASTGLTKIGFDIRLADNGENGANGIKVLSGVISANVDDSTIEKGAAAGNPLQVKDLGITAAKLAADAVETAKIKDLNVTTAKLADDSVTKAKLNADVVGSNQGLVQDADGSLRAQGIVVLLTNNNASQLAAGSVVRISGNNGFDLASANSKAEADNKIGILLETTDAASVGKVLIHGYATATGGGAWTAGAAIFLTTTAGQVSSTDLDPETSSGKFARRVGYAINATQFAIDTGMTIEIE
jgi:hypothetical protein